MKKITFMALVTAGILSACGDRAAENPFFAEWQTPHGVPPFEQIKNEHYAPAFEEGFRQMQAEINAIAESSEAPTFDNTIAAMDNAGALLDRVIGVFLNVIGSDTNDELDRLDETFSPRLSKHFDDVYLNAKLFARVKAVYEQRAALQLDDESAALLERIYKTFTRSGANLGEAEQAQLRELNEELAVLGVKYGQNVLADNNAFRLVVDSSADLAGLPQSVIEAAAEQAKADGMEGKWAFTLNPSSRIPFLQYADNRELRKRMLQGYAHKGNNSNASDNKAIVQKIASCSFRKAQLLGYANHAAFELENRMAQTPAAVYDFLHQLWQPTTKVVEKELHALQQLAAGLGMNDKIQPWDWWYYTEKLRTEQFAFNEEDARPYFSLENVRDGAFMIANKLYGITFTEIADIPRFNPAATAYAVRDADGSELGVFYTDFHPRPSKRGGAWMDNIRQQHGTVRPVIVNICNFTQPTADKPSLLTLDETRTLFHELGHALHGLLSRCKYKTTSGTNVLRDFVELPSQINENWAMHPQTLKMYARHYRTGEPIPDTLIDKITRMSTFNMGFTTAELLAAAFLDMDWYTLQTAGLQDVEAFEKAAMDKLGLPSAIIPRYRSTYFTHIFGGGYSAGYYSYIWAEVLDADAFRAFEATGNVLDPATAGAFRTHILEKGGSLAPMTLYKNFRGKEPDGDALLVGRGLK